MTLRPFIDSPLGFYLVLLFVALVSVSSTVLNTFYMPEFNAYRYDNSDLEALRARVPMQLDTASSPIPISTFAYAYAISSVYTPEQAHIIPRKHWGNASPDTYDSFLPAERYKQLDSWTIDNNGSIGAHFYRPPAYGIVYLALRSVFSVENTYRALIVINLLGHLAIAVVVYLLMGYLGVAREWQLVGMLAFGVMPGMMGFINWLMPEVLSLLSMVLLALALFRLWHTSGYRRSLWLLFLAGGLYLTGIYFRPQVIFAGILFVPVMWRLFIVQHWGQPFKQLGVIAAVAILPILLGGAWTIRNYQLSGDFIPINDYSYPDLRYRLKAEFNALVDLYLEAGGTGSEFNQAHLPFFEAAMVGDISAHYRSAMLNIMQEQTTVIGPERLEAALREYQLVIYEIYSPPFLAAQPLPDPLTARQVALTDTFRSFSDEFRSQRPSRIFTSAAFYLREMLLHSFTAQVGYLQPDVRNEQPIFKALHLIALGLNLSMVALWLSSYVTLLWRWRTHDALQIVCFWGLPMLFVLFMVFYFRSVEQRYFLPFYVFVICAAVQQAAYLSNLFYKRFRSLT